MFFGKEKKMFAIWEVALGGGVVLGRSQVPGVAKGICFLCKRMARWEGGGGVGWGRKKKAGTGGEAQAIPCHI